jgi:flagellar assembly protein FliH
MNMSSRIIRGDGRLLKSRISSAAGRLGGVMPQDHIMDVEKQAFEQGYAEGERIGKQMGEAMVESVCKRYEKSLAELAASHKQMAQAMEEHTVRLALEIARKIVQRELTMDPDLIAALAMVALKRLTGHQAITLRVSRHDFERVRSALANVSAAVTVKDYPALERGDFVIETGQTHVDGRLSSQIDTIGKALFDE